jgi:hypothetical protein
VFVSIQADAKFVEQLFSRLTARGRRVWWDQKCLETGKDWEQSFCKGLVNSRVFVAVASRAALEATQELKPGDRCDNVVLEHALALELRHRKLIERIFAVHLDQIGQVGSESVVEAIQHKLAEHLEAEGFGAPQRGRESTKNTLTRTLFESSEPLNEPDQDLVVDRIDKYLWSQDVPSMFEVYLSFSSCDEEVALDLRDRLIALGVRVEVSREGQKRELQAPIFAIVLSADSLAPLTALSEDSAAPALLVDMRLAAGLHDAGTACSYLCPILVGKKGARGERGFFKAWGAGSGTMNKAVEKEMEARQVTYRQGQSPKDTVAELLTNQGLFVGGSPEKCVGEAAEAIDQIARSLRKGQVCVFYFCSHHSSQFIYLLCQPSAFVLISVLPLVDTSIRSSDTIAVLISPRTWRFAASSSPKKRCPVISPTIYNRLAAYVFIFLCLTQALAAKDAEMAAKDAEMAAAMAAKDAEMDALRR